MILHLTKNEFGELRGAAFDADRSAPFDQEQWRAAARKLLPTAVFDQMKTHRLRIVVDETAAIELEDRVELERSDDKLKRAA